MSVSSLEHDSLDFIHKLKLIIYKKKKYEYYFQKIDNICQEKNDYNEMPLFFEKSEPIIPLQNIPLNIEPPRALTRNFILSCFSDAAHTKFLQNWINGSCSNENIELIVNELIGTYSSIIKNKNGNYFICI